MTEPRQPENVGGCPECGYYGSRTYTEWEDDTEIAVCECLKCGYREYAFVDTHGNARWGDEDDDR